MNPGVKAFHGPGLDRPLDLAGYTDDKRAIRNLHFHTDNTARADDAAVTDLAMVEDRRITTNQRIIAYFSSMNNGAMPNDNIIAYLHGLASVDHRVILDKCILAYSNRSKIPSNHYTGQYSCLIANLNITDNTGCLANIRGLWNLGFFPMKRLYHDIIQITPNKLLTNEGEPNLEKMFD